MHESHVDRLHQLYSINDENLALRRAFIRLGDRDVSVLRRLAGWADGAAPTIAKEFYDHQFSFSETRAFFQSDADRSGRSLDTVRSSLEGAQAGYLRDIFQEAGGAGRFGTDYFERRLFVGRLHNQIDLPLKWYIGSYASYFDLLRSHLRRRFPHRPVMRGRAERALVLVFNLDIQAIVEAFYYDTFATMGVDLSQIKVDRVQHDLSDHGQELKRIVFETLTAVAKAADDLRTASQQMAVASEEAGRAVGEIAHAVTEVATGAERQVDSMESAKALVEGVANATTQSSSTAHDTAAAAAEAQRVAADGAEAVRGASQAMSAVREASEEATGAIRALGDKSERIGGIVETITGIAEQTNLLALNAAIEAARAGEQGRGFAVVAEEVRKLAEESQHAAASIAELIAEIQNETTRAVDVVESGGKRTNECAATVEEAREAFERIGAAVEGVGARVSEIATAVEEIASSSARLQRDITEVAAVAEQTSASSAQVSASTEQTSASTEQIAASAQELAGTSEHLAQLISRLRLAT
jgi:methyl-accepting chemotaxis protein